MDASWPLVSIKYGWMNINSHEIQRGAKACTLFQSPGKKTSAHTAPSSQTNSVEVAWFLTHPVTHRQKLQINSSHLGTEASPPEKCQELCALLILDFNLFTKSNSPGAPTFLKVCPSPQAQWRLHHQAQQMWGPGTRGERIQTDVTTACWGLWGTKQSGEEAAPQNWTLVF